MKFEDLKRIKIVDDKVVDKELNPIEIDISENTNINIIGIKNFL